MAISSIDTLVAGLVASVPRMFAKVVTPTLVAGKPQSLWGLAGIPGAGAFDTTLNGVVLSSTSALVNGQIPMYDPGGGINQYLARFVGAASIGGVLLLCDRLWHNGGYTITSTGVQSSTTPTWPARDNDGATAGAGILLALSISAAAGAAAPTCSVIYTNSAGTGSRTGALQYPTANSPSAGSFFPITLQAGDVGVKSMESIQLSASWISGTMNMVAYRVLAQLELVGINIGNSIDPISGGLPRLFNGTVPFLVFIPTTTTASRVFGGMMAVSG